MNTLWLLGLLVGCVNLVVGSTWQQSADLQQFYQAPRDLQQVQSADIEQVQTADLQQVQTADLQQVQTADLQQVQTADLQQEQSADIEQVQTADLQQEQSADIEQVQQSDLQQVQTADQKPTAQILSSVPQLRPLPPCGPCKIRVSDGECTWSRSACSHALRRVQRINL